MPLETAGKARISPIAIKPQMRIKAFAEQEIEKIHEATGVVLHKTGVRFPCQKALDIFAQAGADVDFKTEIVKIQPDLLVQTLAKAPAEFVMGSRGSQALDVNLDGTKIYGGTSGTGTVTVDLDTRKRRPSVKKDIAMMARISDYLPSISFYWPMVAARDCPTETIALHELEAAFTCTEKHVHIVSCVDEKSAQYAVEMVGAIAGSKERIKARPPLSLIASPISPLSHDNGVLEAALVFAGAGLPVGFAAMPVIGTTAPASIAGALVQGNAEILSSICLLQLACPGAPAFYPLFTAMLNPFTGGISVSSETKYLFYAATVQLGHYYNLPVMTGYGGSDAPDPKGWNVGKDDAVDAFFSCATGPDMAPGLGLLEGYTLLYPEKLLLDDEIYQSVKLMAEGMPVETDALALDEIMDVGPGGHYLDRDYTIRNVRRLWQPGISHQWSAEKQDFCDPLEAAVEKTRWILKNHKPEPIDEKTAAELNRIIDAAENELVKRKTNGL
ncbi:MAG: trimethylamine methyltransferase family protein [Desulfobacterales bacterium]